MMATAPCRTATGTTPAAGNTASVEPTASSRSQSAAARSARTRSSATRLWPKLMVADLRIPPHGRPLAPAAVVARARGVGLAAPDPVVHRLGRLAVAAAEAHHLQRRAVDLDDARRIRSGLLVQPVDVLGDEEVQPAASLEVDQRPVARRWARPTTSATSAGSATTAPAARGPTRRPAGSPSSRPRGSWSTRPADPGSRRCPSPSKCPAPVSTTTRRACSSSARARPTSSRCSLEKR